MSQPLHNLLDDFEPPILARLRLAKNIENFCQSIENHRYETTTEIKRAVKAGWIPAQRASDLINDLREAQQAIIQELLNGINQEEKGKGNGNE